MERSTGSKSLAVAALVSLIIHGGIFFAYAIVYKDSRASKSSQPLMVALVPTAEFRKSTALPSAAAEEERAPFIKEDENHPAAPLSLINDREEAPPPVQTITAIKTDEAAALREKDQQARDLAMLSLLDQNSRPSPGIDLASGLGGAAADLPAAGKALYKATASRSGELSLSSPVYAQLETVRGGPVTLAAPRYSENELPSYPPPARRRGYAGVVMLAVEVLADGRVGRLEMKKTSGYDLLDKSARETVKGWKFSPGKKMGTPVTMWVDVPVRFELN